MTPLSYKAETLAANQPRRFNVTGQALYIKALTQQAWLRVDQDEEFPVDAGVILRFPRMFRELQFTNKNASAISLEFYTGDATVSFVGSETVRARGSDLKPGSVALLNTDAKVTLAGTWNGRQRKQIVVTNLDDNASLYIKAKDDNNVCAVVFPRTAWTMETDADLDIYNGAAWGVSLSVAEFFYR